MQRFLPVLVALLVVAGTPPVLAASQTGDAVPGDRTPVAGVSPDTPRVLELDDRGAADFGRPGLSVTTAIEAETGAMESTLFTYGVETRVERAATEDEKRDVLLDAVSRVDARVDGVAREERTARLAYIRGEDTASTYLETLGRIGDEAEDWDRTLERIEQLSDRGSRVRTQVSGIRADLETLRGPLREEAGEMLRGDRSPERIFVGAATEGAVLSTISDGVYVREAVRTDNRDDAVGSMNIEESQTRFTELYPVAWEERSSISIDPRGSDAWRLQLRHSHGRLTSYLDTSTGHVYRDIHVKTLSSMPTVTGTSVTRNNTTLNVSRTYAGGPLKVAVTNATGAPVDASVRVNGTWMGPTGSDGTVWAVSPSGTYNVTAEHNDSELVARVTAR